MIAIIINIHISTRSPFYSMLGSRISIRIRISTILNSLVNKCINVLNIFIDYGLISDGHDR